MPRDNRCMYMVHVRFYVCCSDYVGVWECLLCSMTCSLLMLVEDTRGDHMEEAYSRAGLITAL